MNTNDLYLEYARVIKMCEGTELEDTPWVCVKIGDSTPSDNRTHPLFNHKPETYKFAVAVLEGKPVFENDIVYRKADGFKVLVEELIDGRIIKLDSNNSSPMLTRNEFRQCFTWTPPTPKRTFTLNGVELPCPVNTDQACDIKRDSPYAGGYAVFNEIFYFDSLEDARKVEKEILNLLTEARDK